MKEVDKGGPVPDPLVEGNPVYTKFFIFKRDAAGKLSYDFYKHSTFLLRGYRDAKNIPKPLTIGGFKYTFSYYRNTRQGWLLGQVRTKIASKTKSVVSKSKSSAPKPKKIRALPNEWNDMNKDAYGDKRRFTDKFQVKGG